MGGRQRKPLKLRYEGNHLTAESVEVFFNGAGGRLFGRASLSAS